MPKQAYVVTDISYGDAGKGTTVDYLVRQAQSAAVIRYNGGPQAAHNVITPDERHHTFAQFGSGSFVPGTATYLSPYMLVNPLNMLREAEHLAAVGVGDIWERTAVDEDALVILPWQKAANKLRELARGDSRHGSCGQGIGEARSDQIHQPEDAVYVKNLREPAWLMAHLPRIRQAKYEQLLSELRVPGSPAAAREWALFHDPDIIPWLSSVYTEWAQQVQIVGNYHLARLAAEYETLVFEGAQGVLLDEAYGFHPYTTWSDTTPHNALKLLADAGYNEPITRLGVLRAYTTRHGAGPFVTEDPSLAVPIAEYHNGVGEWQGAFRYGHLDLVAHRYALTACGGLDGLVVTGLDRLHDLETWQYCPAYRFTDRLPADIAEYFQVTADQSLLGMDPGRYGDRHHQARLTELVTTCSPQYQTVMSGAADTEERERELLRVIEEYLGTRVTITSHGPTAADKKALVTC